MRHGLAWTAVAALALAAWWILRADPAGVRPPAPGPAPASPSAAPGPAVPAAAPAPPALPGALRVVDPDGEPVPGARLEYVALTGVGGAGADPVPLGETGPDGSAPWPPGDRSHPGLVRAFHPDFAPGDGAAPSEEVSVLVRLGHPTRLAGLVVAKEGGPIPGASVEIRYEPVRKALGATMGASGEWRASTRADGNGEFEFRGLPAMVHALLEARAPGRLDAQRTWGPWEAPPVRIEMERPFRAEVRLRDAGGRPLPAGSVVAFQGVRRFRWREGFAEGEAAVFRAAGDGAYFREDLPSGFCWMLLAHPGFRTRVEIGVPLAPGARTPEFVLEEAAGLEGTVVDARTRAPLAGASVHVAPLRTGAGPDGEWNFVEAAAAVGEALSVRTGEDGRFRTDRAGPGDDVILGVAAGGYLPYRRKLAEIPPGGAPVIALEALEVRDVSGRVVGPDGAPVPGALLSWPGGCAAAGADGTFRLPGFGAAWFSVRAPGFLAGGVGFDGPIRGDLGDVVLVPVRPVRGTAVGEDGRPVEGVAVLARPAGDPGLPRGTNFGALAASGPGGRLELDLVPGRAFDVAAREPGGWTGTVRVSGDAEEPFVLRVRPSGRPAGTVRGRLRFADGSWEPVHVGVSAWTPDGDHPVGQPGWADVDGSFAVTGLPAGTWDLRVWTSDAVRGALAGVAVPEGGTVEAVVPCERVPEAERRKPVRPAELLARAVLPGGGEGEGPVRAFATGSRGTRSAEGRAGQDGVFRMKVSDSDTFTVWAWSREARRAGVVRRVPPGAEGPVEVPLAAAGWIVVPGDPEGSVRWLVLKDGEGTCLWSGPESALPGVPGEGVHLVVPPGAYEVVLARGLARRDPRSLRARVLAGAASTAE